MLCRNQGSSYGTEDISWACTSQLPPSLKLGSTDVICEGYDRPDDPYVLKGSCGVEYRLALTSEGERLYPNLSGDSEGVDWSFWLFGIVFVAIALWIIVGACTKANANRRGAAWRQGNNGGWGPGGGWGGGPGRWDDPPPPYPGTKSSADQGWRPGFWTGLAGGAAAAYMAGRRGSQYNNQQPGAGFWGRDGGGTNNGSTWGSRSARMGSGSLGSSSTSRHESTGFGPTSRR